MSGPWADVLWMQCSASTTMDIAALRDGNQLDGSLVAEEDSSPLLDYPVLPLTHPPKSPLLVPQCQKWFLNRDASRECRSLETTLDSWCGYLDAVLRVSPLP